MSANRERTRTLAVPGVDVAGDRLLHAGSVLALGVLSAAWLSVLYHVVDVVGSVASFLPLVAGTALAAVVVGRTISGRTAALVATGLLAVGLAAYLLSVPPEFYESLTPRRVVLDQVSLLTGYSVLQMTSAGVWALAVAAGPLFLTVYLTVRASYTRAAFVGGATLCFFVLTGDSGSVGTMLGVLGAVGAIGFGTLAVRGGRHEQAETVAVAFAAMILSATVLGVAPTVASSPVNPSGGSTTIEASLVSTDDTTQVAGSIRLSPKVRFTVESDAERYWRVGAYDRYTGQGWVRTGGTSALDGRLSDPPGERERVEQRVSPATELGVLPAAAEPVSVGGVNAQVTELDTLQPAGSVQDGQNYTVVSQVQSANKTELAAANGTYPDDIRERYLGVPDSTPDRVGERAANVTTEANATTPYEKAAAIEDHLESTKGYSLDVERPRGSVADAFLFEMDAGYCVYFATTMTTMLREEGVPARYAVGYTSGQRVSEDEWVVRGLDSHAWVEVYLPEQGWTRFDPTPTSERTDTEQSALEQARENDVEGVDIAGSENTTYVGTTTPGTFATNNSTGGVNSNESTAFPSFPPQPENASTTTQIGAPGRNATVITGVAGEIGENSTAVADERGSALPPLPVLAVWTLLGVGVVAAVRRTGVPRRLYRAAWLRYLPDGDPQAVVESAYDRAEFLLERRHRARRDTETVREYLDAIGADERSRRVAQLREAARYGDGPSESDAEEAKRLLRELRRR